MWILKEHKKKKYHLIFALNKSELKLWLVFFLEFHLK